MDDISIHEAERLERRGRRFIALSVLAAITIITATWFGLITFLSTNTAYGTLDDLREDWIPDVESMVLDLPEVSRLSELYTSDRVLLGKLTERNSQPVPLDEIPNLVIGAVLAAEDADFMTHGGIDYTAIMRAMLQDLGGGPTQGGSTITQQVVKQNFIGTEPTLRRKVAEASIALEVERRFTKERILEFYLNSVFFGNNAWGIKAAAQEYFGKDLDELTIEEAAALPVPIRNPSLFDLRRNPAIAQRSRDAVIDQMVQEGYVTFAEGVEAKTRDIEVVPPSEFEELAPQVVIAAKDEILNNPAYGLGDSFLQRKRALFGCPADDTECEGGGGLQVTVTVNYALQQKASEILRDWFPLGFNEVPTGAIAMVDNRTGATVVMASGLEFGTDIEAGQRTYDLATRGRRNPGSAFKPFGLIAAMEKGIPLNSFWDMSTPQILDIGVRGAPLWTCRNAGDNDPGIRSLEEALIFSTNTVFCQVAVEVGAPAISDVAHRAGIRSPLDPNSPAIVLGASAVSPLEMASAYSTFANYGTRVENYLIERIEDSAGNVIYQHRVIRQPVLDSALMAAVVNTMQKGVAFGTGTLSQIGRPQAGKTGTHQNHTDVWFVGFVPQYTTSVWVGFPDSQVEMRNITLRGNFIPRAFGGNIPAPIWREFMTHVVDELPVQDFPPDPDGTGVYYSVPFVEVPDIIGLDREEAEEKLFEEGLDIDIKLVNSEEDEDTVVMTDPEPGQRVRQGTVVEVEVSNGLSPETILPDLTGLNRAQVNNRLTRLRTDTEIDFTWIFRDRPVRFEENADTVQVSDPRPGSTLTEDSRVVIFITIFDPGAFEDPPPPPPDDGDGG